MKLHLQHHCNFLKIDFKSIKHQQTLYSCERLHLF